MVFTSFNFLIFFPSVALLFYLTPRRYRWLILLLASYFFYINIKPVYALLTAGITLFTYIFTILIEKSKDEKKKKNFMIVNIILILLPLFFFKYYASINHELIALFETHNMRWQLPEIKFILPIGISYYTFMSIGYTIDVYNEDIPAEKNPGILALFISFFPLILSGPIERAGNMIPQFKNPGPMKYGNVTTGLKLMLWGYFMKLVVADRIGIYVDTVYANLPDSSGSSLLITSFLYPFQVYADLGGYSLIAIGVSKIMGLQVMDNFKRPFFATSMSEFWRRWHISFIKWLTDYIYTPLSFTFRKFRIWGIIMALIITFLLSGLWHSADMTSIIWGLMQGSFLSFEALTYRKRHAFERKHKLGNSPLYLAACMFLTFILFSSSQVFGRAVNIQDSLLIFNKIFSEPGTPYLDLTTLSYSLLGILILLLKDFKDEYFPERFSFFNSRHIFIRYSSYLSVIFVIIMFGVLKGNSFIYFQF